MSHELRTPMNAIIGYSEMLIEEAEELDLRIWPPICRKFAPPGNTSSRSSTTSWISRKSRRKTTLFIEQIVVKSMTQEVAATIQPLVEKNGNRLQVDCADDCGTILADRTKIRQTLFNLLSNAAKFTEKGSITLKRDA